MNKNNFFAMAKQAVEARKAAEQVARTGLDPEQLGSNADRRVDPEGYDPRPGAPVADLKGSITWQADPAKAKATSDWKEAQRVLMASIGVKDPKMADDADRAWALKQINALLALAPEKVTRFVPEDRDAAVLAAVRALAAREGASELDIANAKAVEAALAEATAAHLQHVRDCREAVIDGLGALEGFSASSFVSGALWPLFGQLVYSVLYGRKYSQTAAADAAKTIGSKRFGAQVNTWAVTKVDELRRHLPLVAISTSELLVAVAERNDRLLAEAEHNAEAPRGLVSEEYLAAQLASVLAQRTLPRGESLPASAEAALLEATTPVVDPRKWPEVAKSVAVAEAARLAKAEKENALAGSSRQARIAAYEAAQKLNK